MIISLSDLQYFSFLCNVLAVNSTHPLTHEQTSNFPQVYTSEFVNLYYGTFNKGQAGKKPASKYKLVCTGPKQTVVGIHLIGKYNTKYSMKRINTNFIFKHTILMHYFVSV